MRKKKLNLKKIVYFLLLLIISLGVGTYWFIFRDKASSDDKKDPVIIEEEKPVVTSIDLIMVGDALIHGNVYLDARVDGGGYNFSHMFENIAPIIKEHDLAYYNQESILGGAEFGYSGYPRFNTPQQFGDNMVELGFNLTSLANNHSLDKGEKGIINSMNFWNTKDVMTAGTYLSEEDRIKDNIKEKKGITYTMLSYTTTTNGLPVPNGKSYLVNVYDAEKVKQDIERVRDKVDLLMVAMHWGVEYQTNPSKEQKEIAAYLSSLGVDIIIGAHPHIIQPVEYIDNTLVFYSLGNFISNQPDYDNLIGLMPSVKITKTTFKGETTIELSDLKNNLIYTYYQGARGLYYHYAYSIMPFEMVTAPYFPGYKNYYDKYVKVIRSLDETMPVTEIEE